MYNLPPKLNSKFYVKIWCFNFRIWRCLFLWRDLHTIQRIMKRFSFNQNFRTSFLFQLFTSRTLILHCILICKLLFHLYLAKKLYPIDQLFLSVHGLHFLVYKGYWYLANSICCTPRHHHHLKKKSPSHSHSSHQSGSLFLVFP